MHNNILTRNEFFEKITKIIYPEMFNKDNPENIEQIIENLEKTKKRKGYKEDLINLYKMYLQFPNEDSLFEKTEISLTMNKTPYIRTQKNCYTGYFCEFWYVLSDFKQYLLKRTVHPRFIYGSQDISYGNLEVIPRFIKAFKCESALYYMTNYYNEDGEKDLFYTTPSFLKPGDELIEFANILDNQTCLDIIDYEKSLIKYFKLRKFDENQIEKLRRDFIKIIFLNKFFENEDESAHNIAVIINGRNVRMAPAYDFEYCCGNHKKGGPIQRKLKNTSESASVEDVINYYKNHNNWFVKWIEDDVLTVDVNKILNEKRKMNTFNFNKSFYEKYINKRLEIVRNTLYQNKDIGKSEKKVEKEL